MATNMAQRGGGGQLRCLRDGETYLLGDDGAFFFFGLFPQKRQKKRMGDDRRHGVHLLAAIGFLVQLCDSVTNYNNAVLPYYSLPRGERVRTREDDDARKECVGDVTFQLRICTDTPQKGHVSPESTE